MAPALGPLVGGALVDSLSWRWVFFVNVPIGVAALVFSTLKLTEHRERAGERFDLPGFLLAASGFGLFLYALSEAATQGWTSPLILTTAVLGAGLIASLVWVELHAELPMIDFRLLGSRLFGVLNLAVALRAARIPRAALRRAHLAPDRPRSVGARLRLEHGARGARRARVIATRRPPLSASSVRGAW